jgi:hypothetical protein
VSDLATLLADPARAAEMPVAEVPALLVLVAAEQARLAAVQGALAARLTAGQSNGTSEDRLLTVGEAAEVLHVTPDWLQRHSELPFVVPVSPGQVRYSARGLQRYIAAEGIKKLARDTPMRP